MDTLWRRHEDHEQVSLSVNGVVVEENNIVEEFVIGSDRS